MKQHKDNMREIINITVIDYIFNMRREEVHDFLVSSPGNIAFSAF